MSREREELQGLLDLHRVSDPQQQEALWRRGIASLARLGGTQPVPLEGLDPIALEESSRVAIENGLVDQLDWLSAWPRALFDLMISLPRGDTKRELGRRILRVLHSSNARTFSILAAALARATPKVLRTDAVRARAALSLGLPYGWAPEVDTLALALISTEDMSEEWLVAPSFGSLPQRIMAAQLLERAAREAWRLYHQGDQIGLRIFRSPGVVSAWYRLLRDRESLAWRHVAAARGVLLKVLPEFREELEHELEAAKKEKRIPRRAISSLASSVALFPGTSFTRCLEFLGSAELDAAEAVAQCVLYGVTTAGIFEPEVSEKLVLEAAKRGGLESYETILHVQQESISETLGQSANRVMQKRLELFVHSEDDGMAAHASALLSDLANKTEHAELVSANQNALRAFVEDGPDAALEASKEALSRAGIELERLLTNQQKTSEERKEAFLALRALDRGLLESSSTANLLALTSKKASTSNELDRLRMRLSSWLLRDEREVLSDPSLDHPALRLARLKALIHLVDADAASEEEQNALRERRVDVISAFLQRVQYDAPSRLRRMLVVTLARACDAALREEWYELSDIALGILPSIPSAADVQIFHEASLIPDLESIAGAYARMRSEEHSDAATLLRLHSQLLQVFPWAGSPRVEAMRASLIEIEAALSALSPVRSRSELAESGILSDLAAAVEWLAQLYSGAMRRLALADQAAAPFCGRALRTLELGLVQGDEFRSDLEGCISVVQEELPRGFAKLVAASLARIMSMPDVAPPEPESDSAKSGAPKRGHLRGQATIPPGQRISGYVVRRRLGGGGAASVFVACREEERNNPNAELFALKRPLYSGQHAQVLSESEFISLFKQEAGTLLTLPAHPNLAGFVTFDMGAKPYPILVMEYIEGTHLGRLMEAADMSIGAAFNLLDGIAAGLETMHSLGIGHLDVKPENIVVREDTPVLVDFGLAGRQYRPGCATVFYGAPEVLTGDGRGNACSADVYSFACLAFEVLAGECLFDGENLNDFVQAHLSHQGMPLPLARMRDATPLGARVSELLAQGLQQKPEARVSVGELRSALASLAQEANSNWPLPLQS